MHKLADTQARIQQQKYSEYDWKGVGGSLKKYSYSILNPLEKNSVGYQMRVKDKLKRLLIRKYPNRSVK